MRNGVARTQFSVVCDESIGAGPEPLLIGHCRCAIAPALNRCLSGAIGMHARRMFSAALWAVGALSARPAGTLAPMTLAAQAPMQPAYAAAPRSVDLPGGRAEVPLQA